MSSYRPKFITKSKEPPKLHEDDKIQATIIDVVYEKSMYKEHEREQYRFDCTLNDYDNYPCKAWLTYYEQPGDRSHLGILVLNLCEKLQKSFTSMEEFRKALVDYRQIYLRVSGFSEPKEKDDVVYPRFKIVPGHLPDLYTPEKIAEFSGPPTQPEEPKASEKGDTLFAAILEQKTDLTPASLNDLITAEIEKSAGMVNYDVATYLVASSLGIPATAKPKTPFVKVPVPTEDPKLSEKTIRWIDYYQEQIGGQLDEVAYSQLTESMRKELTDGGLMEWKNDVPILNETARQYITGKQG